MRYFARRPVYPVIFKSGETPVCAGTHTELERYVALNRSKLEAECPLIDSKWEGWTLYPELEMVSPLTLEKTYTKRDFLLFCGYSAEEINKMDLNRSSKDQLFRSVLSQRREP